MSTHQTVRYSSRNLDLSAQCDEIERNAKNLQNTCAVTLRSGIEPVVQLPESIQLFQMQGRENDIPRLEGLVSSIAKDYDAYIAEKKGIDEKFEDIQRNRPSKKGDLARHSNKVAFVAHEYIHLTERMRQTMICTVDDYMDLIQPITQTEVAS